MSKYIKQMEMDALKGAFREVRDVVVLSVKGLAAQAEHGLRATLRKKNVRLQVVKNSLTRRVFHELGLNVADDSPYWLGPTTMAYGAGSIAELSRAIEAELKNPKTAPLYKDKVVIKGAIADGQPVTFEQAVKMPTRLEAIANVIGMALSPAGRLVSQITAPAARVASQVKTISEKPAEASPAATPA
jgi:large subunit ribosomal protein L10